MSRPAEGRVLHLGGKTNLFYNDRPVLMLQMVYHVHRHRGCGRRIRQPSWVSLAATAHAAKSFSRIKMKLADTNCTFNNDAAN